MIPARKDIGSVFFCSVRINSLQNICWASVTHFVTNCIAHVVKIKDVQSSVQHSTDQGSLQEDVNTVFPLETFSLMKSADLAFSCGLPFVLPSLVKKGWNLKCSFFVLRPLKYLIHSRNVGFIFFFLWFSVRWAVALDFSSLTKHSGIFRFFQEVVEPKASQSHSVCWGSNNQKVPFTAISLHDSQGQVHVLSDCRQSWHKPLWLFIQCPCCGSALQEHPFPHTNYVQKGRQTKNAPKAFAGVKEIPSWTFPLQWLWSIVWGWGGWLNFQVRLIMHVKTVNMSSSTMTATEVLKLRDLRPFMWLCIAKPIFVIYHTTLTERVLGNALFYFFFFFFYLEKLSSACIWHPGHSTAWGSAPAGTCSVTLYFDLCEVHLVSWKLSSLSWETRLSLQAIKRAGTSIGWNIPPVLEIRSTMD